MNKQYKKLVAVCVAALPLTFSSLDTAVAFNTYFDEVAEDIILPNVYIAENSVENTQDNTSVRSLTTSDIMDIIKKYNLINHPDNSAQIMLEKLQIKYKDGLPIFATTKTGSSRIYKYTKDNYSISSIDMYTEYGVLDRDGYDTLVHIKFNGNKDNTNILVDILSRIFMNTNELAEVLHNIGGNNELNKTFTFENSSVDIVKGMKNGRGIQSVELRVYENKNIHDGKILDTVRLQELEQLGSPLSFEEMKNYSKDNSKIFTNSENIDKNILDNILIERAWTNILDITTGKETEDFDIYYIEKSNHYASDLDNYDVVLHIDNYDRFRIGRNNYMCISSTLSKEYLANKAFKIFDGRDDLIYRDDFNTENFKIFSISEYEK